MSKPLVAAIIHYQTPDLLIAAAESFRDAYPDVPLQIVDNGSRDGSEAAARELCERLGEGTEFVGLASNEFHGPAMHRVLAEGNAGRVFFLDSDTITRRPGFLEPMMALFDEAPGVFAVGNIVTVDRRGFAAPLGIRVPASAFMMVDAALYAELPPFIHHGLPVLASCAEAARRGYRVVDFPVDEYVEHLGRGTAERFGYGLGMRSRLEYVLHRLGL